MLKMRVRGNPKMMALAAAGLVALTLPGRLPAATDVAVPTLSPRSTGLTSASAPGLAMLAGPTEQSNLQGIVFSKSSVAVILGGLALSAGLLVASAGWESRLRKKLLSLVNSKDVTERYSPEFSAYLKNQLTSDVQDRRERLLRTLVVAELLWEQVERSDFKNLLKRFKNGSLNREVLARAREVRKSFSSGLDPAQVRQLREGSELIRQRLIGKPG